MGGTSMKDVGGAGFAGSLPPFLDRERAAVDVHVGPDQVRSAAALATMRVWKKEGEGGRKQLGGE